MENPLQDEDNNPKKECHVKVRVPKRIIHCSDGVVEEYSDDEVDGTEQPKAVVDTKTLDWMPWFMHYAIEGGNKAIEYCDYLGEGLADLLGITTPKYQLEISEYQRMEEERKKIAEDSAGWTNVNGENGTALVTIQPTVNTPSEPPPTPI